MYCCVTFTKISYLDNNLSYSIHTLYMHFRFHDIGPLGRGQGGGARGQNLELPEIFFPFISKKKQLRKWLVIHLLTCDTDLCGMMVRVG